MTWESQASQFVNSFYTANNGFYGTVGAFASIGTQPSYMLAGGFILPQGATITLTWLFGMRTASTSSNRYVFRVGMGTAQGSGTDPLNGLYLKYSDNVNGGNWVVYSGNGASTTTVNTAVGLSICSGCWTKLVITLNSAGTSAGFTVDGVLLATITTTMPVFNVNMGIVAEIAPTSGSCSFPTIEFDLMMLDLVLTSSR